METPVILRTTFACGYFEIRPQIKLLIVSVKLMERLNPLPFLLNSAYGEDSGIEGIQFEVQNHNTYIRRL